MIKKEIVCEDCGAVYLAADMPSVLKCTCLGKNFNVTEIGAD